MATADRATRQLGRYRLLRRLGAGGMAVVWRARIEGPEGFVREVVLKRVRADHCRDPEFVRALVHEARLSALLNHPGIVQVHELGRDRDEYFLAMEYIDGCSLLTLLERTAAAARPLSIGLCCHLVAELAGALGHAHELADADGVPLNIVHRDVSPSNVMIERSGAVKLVDFGIAQAAARLSDERTRAGVLKGKLGYLSPEQVGGATADRRSDLFALGVVFYECLTNQRLFSGAGLQALEMVRTAELLPPSVQRPEIPADVDRIALKLLARHPDERYQRGDEVEEALLPIVHRFEADAAALARFACELEAFATPASDAEADATSIRLGDADLIRERTMAISDSELAAMRAAVPREPTIALGERDLLAVAAPAQREQTNVRLDQLIERDQKRPAPRPDAASPAPAASSLRPERTRSGRTDIVRPLRDALRDAPRESAPRQLQLMAAFGVGAVIAVALPVWLLRARPAPMMMAPSLPAAVAPLAPPLAPAAAPLPLPPREVRLIVDGTPGARLIVDGVERGRLPIELTLPSQPRPRTLEIDDPGHARALRQVRGDADAQLEISLQPTASAPVHARVVTRAGSTTTPAAATPARPAATGEIESPF